MAENTDTNYHAAMAHISDDFRLQTACTLDA